MAGSSSLGPVLVVIGIAVVLLGLLVWTGGLGWLGWFGRLSGDLRIERPGFHLFVPFTSMLVVSVVLSLVLYVARRLF